MVRGLQDLRIGVCWWFAVIRSSTRVLLSQRILRGSRELIPLRVQSPTGLSGLMQGFGVAHIFQTSLLLCQQPLRIHAELILSVVEMPGACF